MMRKLMRLLGYMPTDDYIAVMAQIQTLRDRLVAYGDEMDDERIDDSQPGPHTSQARPPDGDDYNEVYSLAVGTLNDLLGDV